MTNIDALEREILDAVQGIPVTFGVAIKHLESSAELLLNDDRTYQLASVFKIPVLVTAMQRMDAGQFRLDDRIALQRHHKTMPSGILAFLEEGLRLTVRDLLTLMIIISDNTATDMVLELVGGPEAVNRSLRHLGFAESEINITMSVHDLFDDVFGTSEPLLTRPEMMIALEEKGVNLQGAVYRPDSTDNVATPRAMNRLNEMIFRGQVASREACDVALDVLLHQTLNDRLPSQLPPEAREVAVAHKTGTFFGVRNDSGIFYVGEETHVAVTIFTRQEGELDPEELFDPGRRELEKKIDDAIGKIGRLAYEHARAGA
jgi:beta-lactamase class A